MSYIICKNKLLEQLKKINDSNVLGRSANLANLLSYLIDNEIKRIEQGSNTTNSPKEIEIAIAVFDKSADFNVAEDASVRVHVSRLRKKLQDYYQKQGCKEPIQLSIPVGEYKIEVVQTNKLETNRLQTISRKFGLNKSLIAVLAASLLSVITHFWLVKTAKPAKQTQVNTQQVNTIWQQFNFGQTSSLIVLGASKNQASKSHILALKNILSLSNDFRYTPIKFTDELTTKDLKQQNVIYIGHYQNLGLLSSFIQDSAIKYNSQTNTLTTLDSATEYTAPENTQQQYIDYGLFAKLQGPRKNTLYILSGFTDSALLWLSWFSTHNKQSENEQISFTLPQAIEQADNYQLLFKVQSIKGADIDAELISALEF
ncbi:helix-turn-helix domain-containing protein [Catenovulum adriaticum]|uniref:Helix-turn-helix domain-containing protein n=1 Tax=Catenovulum adriaticum TaxID=2984846 RepID=A0ABY7AS84_9ALTE|nr:helix-turn-helix domain-containing protein [Catenovulum sp. TS8]WAJ72137.1 helix-turn-helix domain-containing protein [Catenovulum sp. TS8]